MLSVLVRASPPNRLYVLLLLDSASALSLSPNTKRDKTLPSVYALTRLEAEEGPLTETVSVCL